LNGHDPNDGSLKLFVDQPSELGIEPLPFFGKEAMTRFSLSPEELVTDVRRQKNRDAAQLEKTGSVSVNSPIRITQLNAQNPLDHQRFEI